MRIIKYRYYISIAMFLVLAIFSLIQAIIENKLDLVAMLIAVIGFFVFIVIDHVDQAAAIEKLEATVQQLAAPLNFIRAEQIRSQGASDAQRVERISSTKAFEYCCGKVKSARRMYNTSFSVDLAFAAGDYYRRWIQSIVEGITDHDCIVHEVMLSKDRLTALRAAFKSYGKPLKGSYLATDLSSDIDRFRDIPFVEFSLFEYDEDLREVIFGWTSSNSDFLGADCFIVRDRHLVEYFRSYLRRFEPLGQRVTIDNP